MMRIIPGYEQRSQLYAQCYLSTHIAMTSPSQSSDDSGRPCLAEDPRYTTQSYIDIYAGLWAFGYVNGLGQTEGLYRAVASLAFERWPPETCKLVLDFGCGVGRLSAAMASFYREATVIGVDHSAAMIEMAKRIVCDHGAPLTLDLSHLGFGEITLPRLGLPNVEFVRCSGEIFASRWLASNRSRFDIIVAANTLDRVQYPEKVIQTFHELLAPGGIVVGSCPLNWCSAAQWASIASAAHFTRMFDEAGFLVEFMVDDFVYREVLDARGSSSDYRTSVFRLAKR
jgi:2-polyprenyl-3-methyl-5-hydroxy-6-metoxy-1,4-benzoquinol methylase